MSVRKCACGKEMVCLSIVPPWNLWGCPDKCEGKPAKLPGVEADIAAYEARWTQRQQMGLISPDEDFVEPDDDVGYVVVKGGWGGD